MGRSKSSLQSVFELTHRLHWLNTRNEESAVGNALAVLEILGPALDVSEVNPAAIQSLVLACKVKGNGPATINRKCSALRRMLSVALEAGMVDRIPKLPTLKEPEHRTRYLSCEEQRALFGFMSQEVRELCIFLVETGLRTGEARALRWTDVTEEHVTVRKTKGGRPRTVPLTSKASKALQLQRWRDKPWDHISSNQLGYAWNQARAQAGFEDDPEVVPHCLRHTCASRLVQSGVSVPTVQAWLGHASMAMTMRYAHLAPNALEAGRTALETYEGGL